MPRMIMAFGDTPRELEASAEKLQAVAAEARDPTSALAHAALLRLLAKQQRRIDQLTRAVRELNPGINLDG